MDAPRSVERTGDDAPDPSVLRLSRHVVALLEQRRFHAAEQLCGTIASCAARSPDLEREVHAILEGRRDPPPAPPRRRWSELAALGYLVLVTAGILIVVTRAPRPSPAESLDRTNDVVVSDSR